MRQKYNITGMTCAACSARVENVTRKLPGVKNAEVNLLAGTMAVETDSDVSAAVIQAVKDAGYGASLQGAESPKKTENTPAEKALREMKKRIIGSAACLVVLMYFTMGHMLGAPLPHWYHGTENALVAALLQLFLTGLDQADSAADVVVQQPPLSGKGNAARLAGKQPHLQLLFQLVDGLADRRLGNKQRFGGGGNTLFLRNGAEDTVQLQFDGHNKDSLHISYILI